MSTLTQVNEHPIVGDIRAFLEVTLREYGFTINRLIESHGELVNMAFSATPVFNFDLGNIFVMTLTGNITSSTISNARTGIPITLILKQDATGGRTWVPPANFKPAGGALALTAGANKVDSVTADYDGTNWYEKSRSLNM